MPIDVTTDAILNATTGKRRQAAPFPPALRAIIEAGGLAPYVRHRLGSGTR